MKAAALTMLLSLAGAAASPCVAADTAARRVAIASPAAAPIDPAPPRIVPRTLAVVVGLLQLDFETRRSVAAAAHQPNVAAGEVAPGSTVAASRDDVVLVFARGDAGGA